MKTTGPKSLSRLLTRRMLIVQLMTLTACSVLVLIPLFLLPMLVGVRNVRPPDPKIVPTIVESLDYQARAPLALVPTPALQRMGADYPDFWFLVQSTDGQSVSFGVMPAEAANLRPVLSHLISLNVMLESDETNSNLTVRTFELPGGPVKIAFAGGPTWGLGHLIPIISIAIMLAIFLFLALSSIIAIPRFIRRELIGLNAASDAAATIAAEQRGIRIPDSGLPTEVLRLVLAVNAALERLDDANQRRERFLADAAHELRTPVAVLMARIETTEPFEGQQKLLADVTRLSGLMNHLLDLQRLTLSELRLFPVDLVAIATNVVADLAPLAVAAGYEMELEVPDAPVMVEGDAASLERAFSNIARNAIDHGGNRGRIVLRVETDRRVIVSDDGPGIPIGERIRIFEPFHRVKPSREGAGLGLSLVEGIVRQHGAAISVGSSSSGGARFEIRFLQETGNVGAT
ncbi:MAG: HAMP domain-containing sensor histidine kinase [Candidatus Devosia phytovorans]|uniref:histidine kinase n=1 Tax=Candidatus Devosia phytovorans TaxID=3121372 RepID=A0AAJ5VUK3_9HYPH|nr:HAMP domain-containing sensor histidine kinase [Devosia sp.]WEK03649.1 MAG: HAMP domain-containing sensor histidine kinase [Devosia sp.]